MNKTELKKILKPLIKECIKEVIFEDKGALSHIISEVAIGLGTNTKKSITETQSPPMQVVQKNIALREHKKKLLDAIGADAYGGINLFEGTTPAPAPVSHGATKGPMAGISPNDAGVNISNLVSAKAAAIFKRMTEKK